LRNNGGRFEPLAAALLALAVTSCAHSPVPRNGGFDADLRAMGMVYEGNMQFGVDKNLTRGNWASNTEPAYWTLAASAGGIKARFEAAKNVDEAEALRRAEERFLLVRRLNAAPSAYPGMVTHTTEIPEGLKPVERESPDGSGRVLFLHASSRLTYGVGDPGQVAYRAVMASRYCAPSRTSVMIELFFPQQNFREEAAWELLGELRCRE
jgi:hypothetical protein